MPRLSANAVMSWLEQHKISETLAASAQVALSAGRQRDALRLYADAAQAEEAALAALDPSKARTLGITAVSAASLYYKAAEYRRSAGIARKWLNAESLPAFAKEGLREALRAATRSASSAAPPKGAATSGRPAAKGTPAATLQGCRRSRAK